MVHSSSIDDRPVDQPKARSTNYLKFACKCNSPRFMRMAPSVHSKGGVLCGVCFRPFELDEAR